jgi:hypothetical protein
MMVGYSFHLLPMTSYWEPEVSHDTVFVPWTSANATQVRDLSLQSPRPTQSTALSRRLLTLTLISCLRSLEDLPRSFSAWLLRPYWQAAGFLSLAKLYCRLLVEKRVGYFPGKATAARLSKL